MKTLLVALLIVAAGTKVPAYVRHVGPDFSSGVSAQAGTKATTKVAAYVQSPRFGLIDEAVNEAIAAKKLPGAVVLVGRNNRVLFKKAYGNRALSPAVEKMTVDTIFDVASLTKVVATTTAVMTMVEDGKIRLTDSVASFIPEFAKYGKDRVTVRHLLTHMSGLRPDIDLVDPWVGHDKAMALVNEEVLGSAPGTRFVYSDINFELLAEIVERVSKQPFKEFVQSRIFKPLGMTDTMFVPPASLLPRIAPTERCTDFGWPCDNQGSSPGGSPGTKILRGVVHDPTARRMGGVAGHAGLFSTADDLSKFCQMLLNGGALPDAGTKVPAYASTRVLSPLTVSRMTSPSTPPTETNVRGLGWDLDSSYSSNRGEFLPLGSFGHTGFTGTSLWLDPSTGTYIVFLSNRVHPEGAGDVTPLRAKVATIVASTLTDLTTATSNRVNWTQRTFDSQTPAIAPPATLPVMTGIDVLAANGFAVLKDLRVGLVTNHTGRAKNGQSTIDLLFKAPGVKLTALFSPEHGIRGILDAKVPAEKDETTGLPIHSLYGGETERRPTDATLANLDAIVIDLQDVGARFYTYATTVAYILEEAAPRKKKVFILDRPNPVGGVAIDGPALDATATSFVGYFAGMPIRHGMTLGELGKLFNGEKKIGADLTVIAMRNWRRDAYYDETGLSWINPSPNMRNLYAATLYPGVGMIEYGNVSVGRGTDTPFEHIGAPWINGPALSDALNARRIPGVRFYPVSFTPTASKFPNELCHGVFIVITDRTQVRASRLGAELASALLKMSPKDFSMDVNLRLIGSAADIARLKAGDDPATIAASWGGAEARWRLLRAKYLLY